MKHERVSTVEPRMPKNTGTHQGPGVLEVVACPRHETLGFVLSVRTLEALHRQLQTYVFLCRTRAAKIFKSFHAAESRPPGNSEVRPSVRRGPPRAMCANRPNWTHAPSANAAGKFRGHHVLKEVASLP